MGAYTAFLLHAHPGGAFEMLSVKHAFEAINHQHRVHPAVVSFTNPLAAGSGLVKLTNPAGAFKMLIVN